MSSVESPKLEAGRFRDAAAHYAAGRPPYPPALISRVAEITRLRPTDRALDLGCGPGLLAIAFAPYVADVIAIDPEPEMLRQATALAHGLVNIRLVQGSSYDLAPALGRFKLVIMGRSFHWMDRPETLRRLDTMIEPDGAIALFGDTHPDVPDNAWRPLWRAVLDRYTPEVHARHRGPGWVRHEAVLLDSPFCRLESIATIERRRVNTQILVRRALSMSSLSVAGAGRRVDELTRDLSAALAPFAPEGAITEVVESYALLAWRLQ
jgi:SAM-dependent methyltransferase